MENRNTFDREYKISKPNLHLEQLVSPDGSRYSKGYYEFEYGIITVYHFRDHVHLTHIGYGVKYERHLLSLSISAKALEKDCEDFLKDLYNEETGKLMPYFEKELLRCQTEKKSLRNKLTTAEATIVRLNAQLNRKQ